MISTFARFHLFVVFGLMLSTVETNKTEIRYKKCTKIVSGIRTDLCDLSDPLSIYFDVSSAVNCGVLCGKSRSTNEKPIIADDGANFSYLVVDVVNEFTNLYSADNSPILMYANSSKLWYFGKSRYTTARQIPSNLITNIANSCIHFNYEKNKKLCVLLNKNLLLNGFSTELYFDTLIDPINGAELHANTYKIPLNGPNGYSCHYYQVDCLMFSLFVNYFFKPQRTTFSSGSCSIGSFEKI